LNDGLISHKKIDYDKSILPLSPMKVGEDNPQAREEEVKLSLLAWVQLISGWNSQNVGIRIPWESHSFQTHLMQNLIIFTLKHNIYDSTFRAISHCRW